ncbi:hypothetical protein [Ornithinimicrobium cryptoxanthini]|uniref:Uncharacterized protein n=1 Tax=Ornithinimicrobium cryptoxanthini TaxID=2934161 RepID=A0ABY4YHD1_9MICO|nr:hypothetical protein [Ornithinimicrobium cryptoxanthini]USQ75680.1 hypothetical protein NF557_13820 [Ornithinimicrobium cryptoxanthini]
MSDQPTGSATDEVSDARQEAAENVVERVESWDEGAEPATVREDLQEGMEQAGARVEDAELDRMSEEIHDDGSTEAPEVE